MENLEVKPKLYINPPPRDRKCERCGKHLDELQPFSENSAYPGAKLVKTFRAMQEKEMPEYEAILDDYKIVAETMGYDKVDAILEAKYGKKMIEDAMLYEQLSGTVGASWECVDCITK